MRVLAIDTALEACSAGVLDTERAGVVAHESRAMLRGHAEALIPLIARVLERARLTFSEIDRIAVTTGPGSFTGLRVGIAAAQHGTRFMRDDAGAFGVEHSGRAGLERGIDGKDAHELTQNGHHPRMRMIQ